MLCVVFVYLVKRGEGTKTRERFKGRLDRLSLSRPPSSVAVRHAAARVGGALCLVLRAPMNSFSGGSDVISKKEVHPKLTQDLCELL